MGRNTFCKKLTDAVLTCVMAATALFIINYYLNIWNISTAVAATPARGSVPDKALLPPSTLGEPFPAENRYCLTCHQGIEPTRPLQSGMMEGIMKQSAALGDPNG